MSGLTAVLLASTILVSLIGAVLLVDWFGQRHQKRHQHH